MIKVAMVGAGGMATVHARAYARMPDVQVVAVADASSEAAGKLASEVGAQPYAEIDEMLDKAGADVVDVCVPTPWHAQYVCAAAERQPKGIVVEKPMGRTLQDCKNMIEACNRRGILLYPAHVLRFFPEFASARQQVLDGAVGEVAAVRTRRGGPFPRAWNNWYGKQDLSGGVIMDLVIHDFDWLRWTFGEVERVFAYSFGGDAGPGAELTRDYALVTLRFASGVIGHVEGTWADPGGFKVAIEIAGRDGLLEYNFNQPTSPAYSKALESQGGGGPGVAIPENPTAEDPYYLELEHFIHCLRSGKRPCITAEDGLEAVRIAVSAIESASTGKPVRLVRD